MPNQDQLDHKARHACLLHAIEIMKAQKYGLETADGPANALAKLYEKLKELALDVRAGG